MTGRRTLRLALVVGAAVLAVPVGGGAVHAAPTGPGTSPGHAAPTGPSTSPGHVATPRPAAVDPGATVITFDEYPLDTPITTQYQRLGVDFGGDAPFISVDGANPTAPVLAGSPRFFGSIRAAFVRPDGRTRTVSGFTVSVGYIDSPRSVLVTVYDRRGAVITVVPVDGLGIVDVRVAHPGIAAFLVASAADEDAGFAIDNLSVDPAVSVALGDSFSSGEGNPPFDADSDTGADTCHRSADAWPRRLATDDRDVAAPTLLACSGALSTAISSATFKTEAPQLTQLATLAIRPDLVTITIGGNDIGFADVFTVCFLLDDARCAERIQQAIRFTQERLPAILGRTYTAVRRAVGPDARIVVVGYPNLMNPMRGQALRSCGWLGPRGWFEFIQASVALDRVIATAAGVPDRDTEFVSTQRALRGHELCTVDSWVYPIGLFGGQLRGHPIQAGQQAIADAVRLYLRPAAPVTRPVAAPTPARSSRSTVDAAG